MKVELEKIYDISSGGTPSKKCNDYYDDGKIKWVKTGDLKEKYLYDTNEYITQKGLQNSSAKLYQPDTVLIAMYGATIGATSILKSEACTNQACAAFVKNDKVIPEYLYYFFKSHKRKFIKDAVGGAQPNISAGYLKKVRINLISIEDQRKIVENLGEIEELICNEQEQVRQYDNLIKSRFVEMFGDENNSKQWNVVNVEDVADVQVGVVIKPSQYYTDERNGIKAFRSLNIGAGYIKDSDWTYFTKEGHEKNSKSILRKNDLLIVRSGAPGTACVVTEEYAGCNAIDIIIAHPNCELINSHYLCEYTNMPHGKKQIEEGTGGAAQQHFNVGKYNKLHLMLPPMEVQDGFVKFKYQVDKLKAEEQRKLEKTQILFDSLMQQYFG